MMNQPGQSLFQGAGSLHLNTSAQRQEEEEELLDQERRRKEVQQRLDNEFGDLSDDNDETAASNAHSFSDCPPVVTPIVNHRPMNGGNHIALDADNEHAMLMVRFKEQQELEDLRRRLAICESEKQRAFMARQQSHELLVESKGKISEQEDAIQKMKVKMQGLEQKNTQLETELEHKKTLLSDAHIKAQMFERTVGITADRNVDILVKQTNDRCKAQVDMMQQQIESLRGQLEDRSREAKNISTRYTELQRSREAMLVEKSETINQLSRAVEDSQRHCQMLMAKHDGQTEAKLQGRIHELSDQVETMHQTIGQLERSLQTAHNDLDSIINKSDDQMIQRSPLVGIPTNSKPVQDTTSRLKNELQRCLNDQRQLRSELKHLQEQLDAKNAEMKNIRDDENRLLVDMEKQKDECHRNAKRVKLLQTDLTRIFRLFQRAETADQDYTDRLIEDIEQEFFASKEKYAEMQSHQENLIKELAALRAERNSLENRLLDMTSNKGSKHEENVVSEHLKQLQDECERLRELYLEASKSKEAISLELAEAKRMDLTEKCHEQLNTVGALEGRLKVETERYKKLEKEMNSQRIEFEARIKQDSAINKTQPAQNECDELRCQLTDLTKQLQNSTDLINDLRQNLSLKKENDKLIADLATKAVYFDNYIQAQTTSTRSLPDNPSSRCVSAPQPSSRATTPSSTSSRKDEERIAKVFASKLKRIEDAAAAQESQFRNIIHQLQLDLNQNQDTLDIRSGEVEMLKHAILAERKQTKDMMDHVNVKHENLLKSYMKRLHTAIVENEELTKRIDELNDERKTVSAGLEKLRAERELWRNDRDSWSHEKQQWLMDRENVCLKENQLKSRISELEAAKEKIISDWETKYKRAKKTAASYKKYADEKDQYIDRENERVKVEFDEAIRKMQEKFNKL